MSLTTVSSFVSDVPPHQIGSQRVFFRCGMLHVCTTPNKDARLREYEDRFYSVSFPEGPEKALYRTDLCEDIITQKLEGIVNDLPSRFRLEEFGCRGELDTKNIRRHMKDSVLFMKKPQIGEKVPLFYVPLNVSTPRYLAPMELRITCLGLVSNIR